MKKIVLFFVLALMFSCTDKNDDMVVDELLSGEWVLNDVYCFCYFGDTPDFSDSKLLFNAIENKITVVHEGESDYFHASGVFSYKLDNDTITISGDTRSYIYDVKGDVLTLTFIDEPMIADDEVTYKYARK